MEGLEQISHLFLSRRATCGQVSNRLAVCRKQQPCRPSPAPTRSLAVQSNTSVAKTRLAAMLREVQGSLEDGLRVLDVSVPCHPYGEIDLLAVDHTNQLTVIDFETDLSDGLLLRGIAHIDWIVHNVPNVRRMYPGHAINVPARPRLFLLAPKFSSLMLSVARHLSQLQIEWIRYHVLEMGDATGMFFGAMSTD
jgi:hypothetical protein